VLDNPLLALVGLLHYAITAYVWIIIARALISWVSPDPHNPIVRFLYRATEPVLRPIRRRMSTYAIGLDLSPLVAILALEVIDWLLVTRVAGMAMSLD
jgi:YggT family protein